MTYKLAYDIFEDQQRLYTQQRYLYRETLAQANGKALEALEKQIPKKPKINHYEGKGEKPYTKICCPNGCHIQLYPVTEKQFAYEHVYCPKCGQAIDWSEEEKK